MMESSRIAVLGLGKMGIGLAQALLRRGYEVTVWNRTAAKGEALVSAGAKVAADVAAAVAAADIVILCINDYVTGRALLADVDVRGRTIVQLTSGGPQEAREMASWAHDAGALFLEGMILCYPQALGTSASRILYAGSDAAYAAAGAVVENLRGSVYLGTEIGSVSALAAAIRTYYVVTSVTVVLCAEMAQRIGASADAALDEIDLQHAIVMEGVRSSVWAQDDAEHVVESTRAVITRLAESTRAMSELAGALELDAGLLEAAHRHYATALELGHADEPVGAVADALDLRRRSGR